MNAATMAVMTSSAKPDWQTPDAVLERVRRVAPIAYDPCTVSSNPTKATHYTAHDLGMDSLPHDWASIRRWRPGLIYCNPPYGRSIGAWVDKCREAAAVGETVIALLPARTDTRWFPWDADALCFWKGRLTFRDAPAPAPFPSVVAFWGGDALSIEYSRFLDAFWEVGTVVRPGQGVS